MRLLSQRDLKLEKGIDYSACTLWRKVRARNFPAPVKLGSANSRNFWLESDVDAFLAGLGSAPSKNENGAPSHEHPGENSVPRTAAAADQDNNNAPVHRRGKGRKRAR